jgi:hypothetical protein
MAFTRNTPAVPLGLVAQTRMPTVGSGQNTPAGQALSTREAAPKGTITAMVIVTALEKASLYGLKSPKGPLTFAFRRKTYRLTRS